MSIKIIKDDEKEEINFLGEYISHRRKAADISQMELAKQLSIPQQDLNDIEHGRGKLPDAGIICGLEIALKLPAMYFYEQIIAGLRAQLAERDATIARLTDELSMSDQEKAELENELSERGG